MAPLYTLRLSAVGCQHPTVLLRGHFLQQQSICSVHLALNGMLIRATLTAIGATRRNHNCRTHKRICILNLDLSRPLIMAKLSYCGRRPLFHKLNYCRYLCYFRKSRACFEYIASSLLYTYFNLRLDLEIESAGCKELIVSKFTRFFFLFIEKSAWDYFDILKSYSSNKKSLSATHTLKSIMRSQIQHTVTVRKSSFLFLTRLLEDYCRIAFHTDTMD